MSQKRLILEYAKNQLRPQNMGEGIRAEPRALDAPRDLDMNVVQNKVDFARVAGLSRDLREGFHVKDVGFSLEIYMGDEKDELRVVRDGEGWPVKPVFNINV